MASDKEHREYEKMLNSKFVKIHIPLSPVDPSIGPEWDLKTETSLNFVFFQTFKQNSRWVHILKNV